MKIICSCFLDNSGTHCSRISCTNCSKFGVRHDNGILLEQCRTCKEQGYCYSCSIHDKCRFEATRVIKALKVYYNATKVDFDYTPENNSPCCITVIDENNIICVSSASKTFSEALANILLNWGMEKK